MKFTHLVLAVAAVSVTAACGSSYTYPAAGTSSPAATTSPTPATATAGPALRTASVTVTGKAETVLVDPAGMTLYYFTPDKGAKVTCLNSCAAIWTASIVAGGTPQAGPGVTGVLSTVTNPSRGSQLTYNGWPLYTYTQDHAAGDSNGQGIAGQWYVATPDLAAVAPTTTPGSGYGY